MLNVIEGQVSIFDIPVITHKEEVKNVMKRVIFKPKHRWQANLFNKFKIGKEYEVVDEYKNRCGIEFYVIDGIEKEAWRELFEDIKE
jgi:hypothetical protein|nr:MAG TPA: hypothetical protein [Caudoviricetes sp.]DAZ05600.1 MAG TPA: hypothetical protein [Caudoviricetes sp.]